MRLYLSGSICCLVLCVAAPALAQTVWDCAYKESATSSAKIQRAKIELDGKWLNWKIRTALPSAFPEFQFPTVAFRHRILINNEVGIVAASAQSKIDRYVGTAISADVIVINKKDGGLRISDVGLNGSHDAASGHCDLAR